MHGIAKIQNRRRRKAHRRKQIRRLLLILALIAVCVLLTGITKAREKSIVGYEYKTTDTLWGLLEYCPEDMDRWEYLDLVMEINGMSDRVVYKNRLYQVPVFEKKGRDNL